MVLRRVKESQVYQRIQTFVKRFDRFLMPGMLVLGTVVDAVQFRLLSVQTTFTIMGVYAVVCVLAMIVMASPLRQDWRLFRFVRLAAPLVQQFTIGALLSTSLLFYWFSGTISVSWPIIGVVALLMVFNEALRNVFTRVSVQVGVFMFVLISLTTTLFAFVFNSLSPVVFVVGGVASLVLMAMVLVLLIRASRLYEGRWRLWLTVTGVFAFMNIFYFLNVIPPIPLSLREAGMYYEVARSGGEYILIGEEETWLQRLLPGQTMTIVEGEPLYAYTSIFAPADLSTRMVHRWERKTDDGWETVDRLSFSIVGGRSEGYRGYSMKTRFSEGKWRVTVETERGQVLGRIPFQIRFTQ